MMSNYPDVVLNPGSNPQCAVEIEVIEPMMTRLTEEQEVPNAAHNLLDKSSPSSSHTSPNTIKIENVEFCVEPNTCRVCLDTGIIPICGSEKYGNMIDDLISFANIKVSVSDALPKHLCYNCYLMLQSAVQWRKTAMESEAKLLECMNANKSMNTGSIKMKSEKESVCNTEHPNLQSSKKLVKPVDMTPMKQHTVKVSDIQPLASTSYIKPMNIATKQHPRVEPVKQAIVIKSEPKWSPTSTSGLIIKDLSLIRQEIMKNMPETFSSTSSNSKGKKSKLDLKEIIRLHRLKSGKNSKKSRHTGQEEKKTVKKLKFHCKRCSLTFDTKEQCHEHKHSEEHKNCKLPCTVCGQFYVSGYMKVHMEFHNKDNERKYVCDHCGKDFKSSITFYQHRRSHTQSLIFKCAQCSYRHWDKHVLKRHQRIHMSAEHPFHCHLCPKTFTLKCNLNKHLLTHEGPKLICTTCQKKFYDKPTLDKHYKSDHLGIKEHVCKICNAAFGLRNKLMKHERNVHKRAPFPKGRRPCYLTPKYENRVSDEGIIIEAEEDIEKV